MGEYVKTIQEVADAIDPRRAQFAMARILQAVGEDVEWDSETMEKVAHFLVIPDGVPDPTVDPYEDEAHGFAQWWADLG